jgi:hypothetical protein
VYLHTFSTVISDNVFNPDAYKVGHSYIKYAAFCCHCCPLIRMNTHQFNEQQHPLFDSCMDNQPAA